MKSFFKNFVFKLIKKLPIRIQNAFSNMFFQTSLFKTVRDIKNLGFKIKNIYDVGAHKGNWSVAMNKELPDANFYLFEANSHHEEDLKKLDYQYYINVLSNNEKNIDFYSNNAGTGDSYYKENTSTYDTVKSKQITSKTLDDLVKKNKIPFPDFIKIDTQGSELDILNGAHDCLKNAQLLLLECPVYPFNSGAPTMPDYIDFLLKFNFYPSQCVELHNLSGVLIQIDILFLNKKVLDKLNTNFEKFYKIFK